MVRITEEIHLDPSEQKTLDSCLLGTVQQATVGWNTLTLEIGAHLTEDRPEKDSALPLLSQGIRAMAL